MKNSRMIMERDRIKILRLMAFLPLLLMLVGLGQTSLGGLLEGLKKIVLTSDLLLTDYIVVGGIGATLVNAGLVSAFNLWIISKQNIQINGSLLATFFTVMGFCFMGINLFNILPLYLGAYVYTRYQEIPFKNVILMSMLGTGISPVVSQLAFNSGLTFTQGLAIGIMAGILIGFIMPPLSAYLLRVHAGYNIYNIGFTAGLIGTIMVGFMNAYGLELTTANLVSNGYSGELMLICLVVCLGLLYSGLSYNEWKLTGIRTLTKRSGRLVTDFTQLDGYGPTFINMSIMGVLSMLVVLIMDGTFNGPVMAGVFTVIGFSAFGKHPMNALPIMLGVYLAAATSIWEISSTAIVISALFGTTLAPIAGSYGMLAGVVAGFIHLLVVMNIGALHGGINLFNNGFSGGLVAAVLIPIFDAFKKGESL